MLRLIPKKDQELGIDNFPLAHISASSMIKFSGNPILFKIGYINRDEFETVTGAGGVLGKAFHHAMEVYAGGSDTLIPTSEADAIEFGLIAGMSFLEGYNDGYINFTNTIPNKQKLYDLLTFCFNSYVQQMPYGKAGSVVAVEDEINEYIDVEWRGEQVKLPVKLKGFLDKVWRDTEGRLRVTDYKTCYAYSPADKIDGAKMLAAVEYFLLSYAKYGEAPHSITFEEIKYSKNSDGSPQVRSYEVVYAENPLYFDFYFRFYGDMIKALNGEQVYVPNVQALFDNEIAIIAYIHRLDIPEETAKQMKKHKVTTVTDLLKKEIQSAGNMRKLLKAVEAKFVSAKSMNYDDKKPEERIQLKMMEHGMVLKFDSIIEGASVDLYRYTPSLGLKMARIGNYVADVEQVLGISGIRVLAPIPQSTLVGFEVPRKVRAFPKAPKPTGTFEVAVGQDILGEPRRFDIRTAPHLLIAGASGSGKSIFLHILINQLAKIPDSELYLFDPKIVELAEHKKKAYLYLSDSTKIAASLTELIKEMNERYKTLAKAKVRSIEGMPGMPYKFVIIDEFGDLMLSEHIQGSMLVLAQKGRAAGIHLIIATQRPSVDIIKGTIKANFNTKIVFKTAKEADSRVVLDEKGAEKLLGKGDMLFSSDAGIERLQGFNI